MTDMLDGIERELRPAALIKTKAAFDIFRSRLGRKRITPSRAAFERDLEVFLQSRSDLRAASRRHIRKIAPLIIEAAVVSLKKARLILTGHAPNTALEPTPITPVRFRFGFPVGASHRRRGSAFVR